jgi:pimeloyl-ACP methyl ester carboxylesterase
VNPIVVLAGVGLWDSLYEEMKQNLSRRFAREKIFIVPIAALDWIGFPPSPERSTNRVMKRLHETLLAVELQFPDEPISLVAHSGGGTVALIYLLGKAFQGDVYQTNRVSKLLALGTPFQSREPFAKVKSEFIKAYLTNDFFERVQVISVASSFRKGDANGTVQERLAFACYRNTFGEGAFDGDGIVPIDACILEGAKNIVISGAEHLPSPFGIWYGSLSSVAQWQGLLMQDG